MNKIDRLKKEFKFLSSILVKELQATDRGDWEKTCEIMNLHSKYEWETTKDIVALEIKAKTLLK